MNDHSSLSKVFSKSIFKVMLGLFPIIFLKWVMNSWIIIALLVALLLDRKLTSIGPIILGRIGLILFTMIFVTSL